MNRNQHVLTIFLVTFAVFAGSAIFTVEDASAQTITANPQQKIIPSDITKGDNFGWSVATHGDTMVVGAHNDGPGSVYVYTKDDAVNTTWTQTQKIVAPNSTADNRFGESIAIHGDVMIVGVPRDDHNNHKNAGAVYIYTKDNTDTWTQTQKIVVSDSANEDNFGWSVAINADTAVIGVPNDDDTRKNSGSAYIYTKNSNDDSWIQTQKIVASKEHVSRGDNFGWSVAINSDAIIVGAYHDNDNGKNSGAAYIYTKDNTDTWTQTQKIVALDGAAGDNFGETVTINDHDTILVGSSQDDDHGSDSGSVYIYTKNGNIWSQSQKIIALDGTQNDRFGSAVTINDDNTMILVGAPFNSDDIKNNMGAVYMYTKNDNNTWTLSQNITAPDGESGDRFGLSVAIHDDNVNDNNTLLLIGTPFDNTKNHGKNSGSVHVMITSLSVEGNTTNTNMTITTRTKQLPTHQQTLLPHMTSPTTMKSYILVGLHPRIRWRFTNTILSFRTKFK